jgi:hypothetical protein
MLVMLSLAKLSLNSMLSIIREDFSSPILHQRLSYASSLCLHRLISKTRDHPDIIYWLEIPFVIP